MSSYRAILAPDLEPTTFDDLPLGGEWTTRRRTISETEIALFAAISGDFSPLTIDTSGGGTRFASPALLVAMAIGLGSVDMPVPSVASWDWVNWKFPRPVRAGDTIYARWTLTQKRPPLGGSETAIVVWRVDVHVADGALCAEGEVGASVRKHVSRPAPQAAQAATSPASATRRRRRRRTPSAGGAATASPDVAIAVVEAPAATPTAAPATPERSGGTRRRRRRRPQGTPSAANGDAPSPAAISEAPTPVAQASTAPTPDAPSPLSRVIRRLRGA